LEEVDAVDHAVELLPRNVHRHRVHAARGDHHRVMALAELVQGDVTTDLDVVMELHAVLGDPCDVELDHVPGEAEGGNPDQAGAATRGKCLVDVGLVSVRGELFGTGQASRPGTNYAHALAGGPADLHVVGHVVAVVPIDQEALHGPDGQRLVVGRAAACLLARRAAHVAADRRDRVRVAS